MTRLGLFLVLIVTTGLPLTSQALRFEVTSVKPTDSTGSSALFDPQPEESNRSNAAPTTADQVFFTATQEQLGLRLEPGRGPVEVLVIDSVERPTPD